MIVSFLLPSRPASSRNQPFCFFVCSAQFKRSQNSSNLSSQSDILVAYLIFLGLTWPGLAVRGQPVCNVPVAVQLTTKSLFSFVW